jgi:hypothetical protein
VGEDFLAVLMPLLGKCFAATLSPGTVDTHCFEPLYDRAHIEDRHAVTQDGATIYEGLSIYSATPDGLSFTYVNSEGGSGNGVATVDDDGFDFQMTMRASATAESQPMSGHWTVRDDGYDVVSPGEDVRAYDLVP